MICDLEPGQWVHFSQKKSDFDPTRKYFIDSKFTKSSFFTDSTTKISGGCKPPAGLLGCDSLFTPSRTVIQGFPFEDNLFC
jgi:hypothetical protein